MCWNLQVQDLCPLSAPSKSDLWHLQRREKCMKMQDQSQFWSIFDCLKYLKVLLLLGESYKARELPVFISWTTICYGEIGSLQLQPPFSMVQPPFFHRFPPSVSSSASQAGSGTRGAGPDFQISVGDGDFTGFTNHKTAKNGRFSNQKTALTNHKLSGGSPLESNTYIGGIGGLARERYTVLSVLYSSLKNNTSGVHQQKWIV